MMQWIDVEPCTQQSENVPSTQVLHGPLKLNTCHTTEWASTNAKISVTHRIFMGK